MLFFRNLKINLMAAISKTPQLMVTPSMQQVLVRNMLGYREIHVY